MKKALQKYLPVFLMVLVSTGIIYHNFKKILACPECYMYEDAGDGLKNYFTFTWFVLEDRGTHFSGMNAPYGEHIFFTDNHPGLAMVANFIHRNITDLNGNTVGILNILLIISLFIAILVLYRIFRILAVGRYPAAAFAMVITFLSPQILRFSGHYSLAHVSLVPIYLWLLLKFHLSDRKWIWAASVVAWTTVSGFIHLYYFLMMSVFTGFYLVIDIFARKYWKQFRAGGHGILARGLQLLSMFIVPAFLILLFLHQTDPITDRPTSPWRSIELNARFHGTFVPNYGPFPDYWKGLFGTSPPNPESMAYVSLVGFFFIPVALAFLIRGLRRKRKLLPSHIMHSFLLASVGVWAIAAGMLYAPPFNTLLDIIPKLKQFRGLGRLAWMFYYVYTIFIAFYLYRLGRFLKIRARHPAGYYLVFVSLLLMGFEAYLVNSPVLSQIKKANQFLDTKSDVFTKILEARDLEPDDFQAILQLPLVNLGGETSGVEWGFWTLRKGVQAAFDMRLPLVDWALSRTSVSQSADFVQLISSTAVKKERLAHMNEKPLLLICAEESVKPAEKKLIEKATFLGKHEWITVYSLPVSAFDQDLAFWRNRLDTLKHPAGPITAMNFEENPHPDPLVGDGVKFVPRAKEKVFSYTSDLDTATSAMIHLWVYIDAYEAGMSVLRVRESTPDGKVNYDQGIHRRDVDWSEVVGQWMRIDRPVTIRERGHTYDFFIDADGTVIDALQVREAGKQTVVDYPSDGIAFLNGVLVRK